MSVNKDFVIKRNVKKRRVYQSNNREEQRVGSSHKLFTASHFAVLCQSNGKKLPLTDNTTEFLSSNR